MIYLKNLIINIELNPSLEVKILESFLENDKRIIFPCWESYSDKFVIERMVMKEDMKDDNEDILIWYTPKNIEELLEIVTRKGLCYTCRIVNDVDKVNQYDFELEMYEHIMFEGEEKRGMFITCGEGKMLTEDIYLRIQKVVEDDKRSKCVS